LRKIVELGNLLAVVAELGFDAALDDAVEEGIDMRFFGEVEE
jgi:hypothetical protein